jgi:hypothetical protein
VDCAEGHGPPPFELSVAWGCERWQVLPDAGGYMDQDYVLLSRMSALANVYNVIQRMKNLHGSRIHELTDNERRIARVLIDLGLMFHA